MSPLNWSFKKSTVSGTKDVRVRTMMAAYKVAGIETMDVERLRRLLEGDGTTTGARFCAACELASRGEIEYLGGLGASHKEIVKAAADGLADAACNGSDAALSALESLYEAGDPEIQRHVLGDVNCVVDGTPGDYGYSTVEIRRRALGIIERGASSAGHATADFARASYQRNERDPGINKGSDILTFKGRTCATAVVNAAQLPETGGEVQALILMGDVQAVTALLGGRRPPDLEKRDTNGLTALHAAILSDRGLAVRELLAAGAKADAPVSFALAETGGAGAKAAEGPAALRCDNGSPLHMAIDRGFRDIVSDLIAARCAVNSSSEYGDTPLHLAVDRDWRDGGTGMVSALLAAGADPNAVSKEPRTPTALLRAAAGGQADVAEVLLSNGADADGRAHSSNATALMLAAVKGDRRTVEVLLRSGADANARSGEGNTALLFAVQESPDEVVEMLLEAGADPNLANKNGERPLAEARKRQRESVVALLGAAGAE